MELGEEGQPVRRVRAPRTPSAAEVQEHEDQGHAVYRSWCAICSGARGIGTQHIGRAETGEDRDPVVALDYAFLSKDGAAVEDGSGQDLLTMLVVKEDRYKSYAATVVQRKGVVDSVVSFVVGFIRALGYRRMTLQSDNEPAILGLKKEIRKQLDVEIVERESPPHDHQGNGFIEVGVREIKRQCRAIVLAMEAHLGAVPLTHPLMMWVPRHAAAVLNRYRRGDDGFTPEQRRTGRAWRRPALQFGECVQFKPASGKRTDLAPRLEEGLYVGHHERTGSVICLTTAGAYFGFAVKRTEETAKWQKGKSCYHERFAVGDEAADGEAARSCPCSRSERAFASGGAATTRCARSSCTVLTKADVDQYGGTDFCPGCVSVTLYGTAKSHTIALVESVWGNSCQKI